MVAGDLGRVKQAAEDREVGDITPYDAHRSRDIAFRVTVDVLFGEPDGAVQERQVQHDLAVDPDPVDDRETVYAQVVYDRRMFIREVKIIHG